MKTIDLIPAERRAARAQRRRVVRWGIAVGAYAALVLVAGLGLRMAGQHPEETHDSEMRRAAERIELSGLASKQYGRDILRLQRQLDAAVTVGRHPDWSLLLAALAKARGEEVVLDGVELTPSKVEPAPSKDAVKDKGRSDKGVRGAGAATAASAVYVLRMTGFARTAPKVFEFAHALESIGPLENVTIVKTQSSRVGTLDVTGFELTASISDRVEGASAGEGRK